MPVHPVRRGGRVVGYRYGTSGKLYTVAKHGKAGAARKAGRQAGAIRHSQKRSGKKAH